MRLSPQCVDEVESRARDCDKSSVAVPSTGPLRRQAHMGLSPQRGWGGGSDS